MKIDLLDLDCEVFYSFESSQPGGSHPHGGVENLPPTLTIYMVKCKEIEITKLLSEEQLSEIEEKLLETKLGF